jgi:hypothetical protein
MIQYHKHFLPFYRHQRRLSMCSAPADVVIFCLLLIFSTIMISNYLLPPTSLPPILGGEGQRSTIPIIPCQNTPAQQTYFLKIFLHDVLLPICSTTLNFLLFSFIILWQTYCLSTYTYQLCIVHRKIHTKTIKPFSFKYKHFFWLFTF